MQSPPVLFGGIRQQMPGLAGKASDEVKTMNINIKVAYSVCYQCSETLNEKKRLKSKETLWKGS